MVSGNFNGQYFTNSLYVDEEYFDRLSPVKPVDEKKETSLTENHRYFDREIPLLTDRFRRNCSIEERGTCSPKRSIYADNIYEALFDEERPSGNGSLLSFERVNRTVLTSIEKYRYIQEKPIQQQKLIKKPSVIPVSNPYRSVAFKSITDDFYFNVLDVSAKDNVAIARGDNLFVLNKNLDKASANQFIFDSKCGLISNIKRKNNKKIVPFDDESSSSDDECYNEKLERSAVGEFVLGSECNSVWSEDYVNRDESYVNDGPRYVVEDEDRDVRELFYDKINKNKRNPTTKNPISCVHWIGKSDTIFSAFSNGDISYIDYETGSKTHINDILVRIFSAASQAGSPVFYAGTHDERVFQIDSRKSSSSYLNPMRIISEQTISKVCGVALSSDGLKIAMGTDSNQIGIWDVRKFNEKPCILFHCFKASVKGITWSPWERDVIYAGGGIDDPVIRKLSTASNGKIIAEDRSVGSQITAVHAGNEPGKIVSCHGCWKPIAMIWNDRNNQFIPRKKLVGHYDRILYSSLTADKKALLTAGADGQLHQWELSSKRQICSSLYDKENSNIR